ncbi:MAG: GNAT family N-acetyltransferase [Christensenellaceae bacterium]|nr:GNAT family N-acetyltransferase [Christensenellaceae bacterium]
MAEYTLRPADIREAEQLAGIKSSYVRSLYRGFLSTDYLRKASREFYLPEIIGMMRDERLRVDVLESDGVTVGFVAYGADSGSPDCGLIREEAVEPQYGRREKDALAQHAIRQLTDMGFQTIHLWLLKENFRARFLFESIGFRHDGMARFEPRDGQQFNVTRYAYRIPDASDA